MEKFIGIFAVTLLMMSCDKGGVQPGDDGFLYDDGLAHGMIVLGDRLDNPYTTENAREAFSALYPTKSRDVVQTTDLYVRFLPADQEEFDMLESMGVEMLDHPMDYEIIAEGDYYHDPSVGDDSITWQYAVVDKDFRFPDIRYEIIDECFLADNSEETKAMSDVDWDAVEAESYRLTGNGDMLDDAAMTKAGKSSPEPGRRQVRHAASGDVKAGMARVAGYIRLDQSQQSPSCPVGIGHPFPGSEDQRMMGDQHLGSPFPGRLHHLTGGIQSDIDLMYFPAAPPGQQAHIIPLTGQSLRPLPVKPFRDIPAKRQCLLLLRIS